MRFPAKSTVLMVATGVAVATVVTVSAAHVLWSLLGGAYAADDIWNSQLPAQLHAEHISLVSSIISTTKGWMRSAGRFFPSSVAEGAIVFTAFQSRVGYKAFLIAAVLMDVLLVYVLVSKLTLQRWTAVLVSVLLSIGFGFRFSYDGIQEFSGQQEIMLAFVLVAAISTLKYLDSGRNFWLIAVALSWVVALTTYETSFLLIPILWLTVWQRRPNRKRAMLGLFASGFPTVAIGGYVLYLRHSLTVTTASYTANFSITKIIVTLAKQVVGTLPFTEHYLGGSHDIAGFSSAPLYSVFDIALLLAVAVVIAIALFRQTLDSRGQVFLSAIGFVLLVGPALPIAVTDMWQNTLTWGNAYISAYVEGFGLVLLLVSFVSFVTLRIRALSAERLRSILLWGLIVVASAAGSFTILGIAGNNVRLITVNDGRLGWMNQQSLLGWSRQVVTNAEHAGLFGHPTRSIEVAAITGAAWINSAEVSYESGAKVNVVNAFPYWTLYPQVATQVPGCPLSAGKCHRSPENRLLLYVNSFGYNKGYAILGSFSSATSLSPAPDDVAAVVRNPVIYVESPQITSTSHVELCRVRHEGKLRRYSGIRSVQGSGNWRLIHGNSHFRIAMGTIGMVVKGKCEPL